MPGLLKRLARVALIAAVTASGALVRPAAAADDGDRERTTGGALPIKDEITDDVKTAVKKGLDWLSRNASSDGGYGDSGISGLAGLAFLADGNLPDQGRYAAPLAKTLDYVLKNAQDSGLLTSGDMYGHGFATLFLAEVYGTTQRADVKEKLQKAIMLICQCQNPQGGWRYTPAPIDADISVTICEVMALRAARNAGINVPKSVINSAMRYVKQSQCPDGGFMYTLGGGGSAFPRSAAGVTILNYLGEYSSKPVTDGLNYLTRHTPGTGENSASGHTFYGNYYGTQAMFMAGGDYWSKWWPKERAMLLGKQAKDGSWLGEASQQYSTSMALIILQVPNRLLPILQK